MQLRPYAEGGGHHPARGSAFRGYPTYNHQAQLAIPTAELRELGIPHTLITGGQMSAYWAFASAGNTVLTWGDMASIEAGVLSKLGVEPQLARTVVDAAISAITAAGVIAPHTNTLGRVSTCRRTRYTNSAV